MQNTTESSSGWFSGWRVWALLGFGFTGVAGILLFSYRVNSSAITGPAGRRNKQLSGSVTRPKGQRLKAEDCKVPLSQIEQIESEEELEAQLKKCRDEASRINYKYFLYNNRLASILEDGGADPSSMEVHREILNIKFNLEALERDANTLNHELEAEICLDLALAHNALGESKSETISYFEKGFNMFLEDQESAYKLPGILPYFNRLLMNCYLPSSTDNQLTEADNVQLFTRASAFLNQFIDKLSTYTILEAPPQNAPNERALINYAAFPELEGRSTEGSTTLSSVKFCRLVVYSRYEKYADVVRLAALMEAEGATGKDVMGVTTFVGFNRLYGSALAKQKDYVNAVKYLSFAYEYNCMESELQEQQTRSLETNPETRQMMQDPRIVMYMIQTMITEAVQGAFEQKELVEGYYKLDRKEDARRVMDRVHGVVLAVGRSMVAMLKRMQNEQINEHVVPQIEKIQFLDAYANASKGWAVDNGDNDYSPPVNPFAAATTTSSSSASINNANLTDGLLD